jgi:hypothetical protein
VSQKVENWVSDILASEKLGMMIPRVSEVKQS